MIFICTTDNEILVMSSDNHCFYTTIPRVEGKYHKVPSAKLHLKVYGSVLTSCEWPLTEFTSLDSNFNIINLLPTQTFFSPNKYH